MSDDTAHSETLLPVGDGRVGIRVGAFTLDSTGLVVHGLPDFDEWIRLQPLLELVDSGHAFWIGDWLNYGSGTYGEKYTQALSAERAKTWQNYAYVARQIEPSRRRENCSFGIHATAASLPPILQTQLLERAETESWTVSEARREHRVLQRKSTVPTRPIVGRFRVVYADPPWSYRDHGVVTGSDAYGRAERHYATLPLDALCAMPVGDHVEDDAVLFLWCPEPMRFVAGRVIEAWGFEHKTAIIWDKVGHNFGNYVSVRHEHLLICTRGSCTPDRPTPMPDSVVTIRRSGVHSEKPDEFRALTERLYDGPYLELFGRREVDGWTVYGDQWLTPPGTASASTTFGAGAGRDTVDPDDAAADGAVDDEVLV